MDFGMIRSLLHATPTVEGWSRLCWGLRDEEPQRVVEEFAPYIEGAATRWPAHIRRAPADDVAEQLKDKNAEAPSYLSLCRTLDLRGRNLSRAQLKQLLGWPEVTNAVELLSLGYGALSSASLADLADSPFARLRGLDLSGCPDASRDLLALCAAPWLDGIEALCWHQSPLRPEHFQALASSGLPRTLRALDLSYGIAPTAVALTHYAWDETVPDATTGTGLELLLLALAEHDGLEQLTLNESYVTVYDLNALLALMEQDAWPALHTVGLNGLPLPAPLLDRALRSFERRKLRCWSLDPASTLAAAQLLSRALRTRDWSHAERIGFYPEGLWGEAWEALEFDEVMEGPYADRLVAYWDAENTTGRADELMIIPEITQADQPREQAFVSRDNVVADESAADALHIHHDLLKVQALEEWFKMPLPTSARTLTLSHDAKMARNVIRRIAEHAPFQGQITTLSSNGINPIWRAEDVASFADWRKLHTLSWHNSTWTAEVFDQLMRPAHFPHVRKLCLQYTRWDRDLDPLLRLVELGWMAQLDELHITSGWLEMKLYIKGVKALCASEDAARLRALTLHQITEAGLRHLAGCEHLSGLEELGLTLDPYAYGMDMRVARAVARSTTLSPRVRAQHAQYVSMHQY